MFSGEVMPNRVLNYWRKHLPQTNFVNLYGPTEITCNCTYFMVDRPFEDSEPLPIGISFPNTEIILLNDKDRRAAPGEAGEICVRGASLALGYYNRPDETSRAFCQNSLNPYYPQPVYRTGDLGIYNDLGELMFLTRKDDQIKHMGHRIELAEVEMAANALPFIDAACCIYDAKAEKIVMFYQANEKRDKEILLGLLKSLPKYMTPNRFVRVEKLPLNKNAKIDRALLKKEFIDEPGK
jgi:acyl-CoA synthetase (AMP-forming)/AMP-acid ligase II